MNSRRLIVAALLCAGPATSQVSTWHVGEGGEFDWDDQGMIEAAVEFVGTSLRPRGLSPEENIVATLEWFDVGGTPGDQVTEGQARVWSNVASKVSNQDLVMVDGNASTGTGDTYKATGVRQKGRTFTFDLGASFPADRIVFYPTLAELGGLAAHRYFGR